MQYVDYSRRSHIVDIGYSSPTFIPQEPYVLVVDDDYAILSVMMLLLETEAYAGLGILDSEKVIPFLERAQASKDRTDCIHLPSVILLDLMMPRVTGYEIASWVAHNTADAHIPVIVMTADHTIKNSAAVQGATDLVSKPFQIDTLLSKISRYLTPSVMV